MNIGVSTSCYYPMLTEESLKQIGKSGIKTAEIFFNALCELESDFVNELKNIADYYGINVVSIHPTMSLSESFMLFSAYKRRYTEGINWYKRYAEIAAMFGAKYIIMHGGKPNKVLNDTEYIYEFLKVAETVEQNGAVLLQENVVNFRAGSLEFLKKFKEISGEKSGICLDIKQAIRGGYSPFDVLAAVGDKVKHIHISDSTRLSDCLLPGNGEFDFENLFCSANECGFNGNFIIEVYEDAYNNYGEIKSSYDVLNKKYLKTNK